MYNFDVGEEDARWEADLLEDDREQQIALNVRFIMLYKNIFCFFKINNALEPSFVFFCFIVDELALFLC